MINLREVYEQLPSPMRDLAATLHIGEMFPVVPQDPEDPARPAKGAVITQLIRDTDEVVLNVGDAAMLEARIIRIKVKVNSTDAVIPLHYTLAQLRGRGRKGYTYFMVFDPTSPADVRTRDAWCNQDFDQLVLCGAQSARIVRAPRPRLMLAFDDSKSPHTRTEFFLANFVATQMFPAPESLWEAADQYNGDFFIGIG